MSDNEGPDPFEKVPKSEKQKKLEKELQIAQNKLNDLYVGEQFLDFLRIDAAARMNNALKSQTVQGMWERSPKVMLYFEQQINRSKATMNSAPVEPSAPPLEDEEEVQTEKPNDGPSSSNTGHAN